MTASPSIQDVQEEIAAEFGLFDDWTERFQYIIELGQKAPPVPEALQTEENQVQGCQSKVWLIPSFKEGRLSFQTGSNAYISGGLVTLAVRVFSGHTPDEILTTEPVFIEKIGMEGNITPSRLNGLRAVIKKMKMYALAYKALQERQDSHDN
jgi:cysteine desulfuration protein SufE